jgi:hypothetical protein
VPEGQVAASLNVKSDCSELGPVGSLLTSPDFSTSASVLVVQQYHSQRVLTPLSSRRVLPEEVSAVLPEEDLESK